MAELIFVLVWVTFSYKMLMLFREWSHRVNTLLGWDEEPNQDHCHGSNLTCFIQVGDTSACIRRGGGERGLVNLSPYLKMLLNT